MLIGGDSDGTAPGDRAIGARTHGAASYFDSEVELARFATANPAEPLQILMSIVSHLMAHGAHLSDGQPIQVMNGRCLRYQLHPPSDGKPGLIRLVADIDAAM